MNRKEAGTLDYRGIIDENGIKHRYIAEQIKVSKTMLSLFLSGKKNLSPEKKRLLHSVLKIKL